MKKVIRLTESDLHRIVARCVNTILEQNEGFIKGFKDGYHNGPIQNLNNGQRSFDVGLHGQKWEEGNPEQTKWNAFKNRAGMTLGAIAGGQMPKNITKNFQRK